MSKKTFGFTLIEILVVATVMSLLASLGVASYKSINVKSRNAAVRQEMQEIKTALESYRAINGSYPTSNTIKTLVDQKFIQKYPAYVYYIRMCSIDYLLFSKIEDVNTGIDNTDCITSSCNIAIGQSGEKAISAYSGSLLKCYYAFGQIYNPLTKTTTLENEGGGGDGGGGN